MWFTIVRPLFSLFHSLEKRVSTRFIWFINLQLHKISAGSIAQNQHMCNCKLYFFLQKYLGLFSNQFLLTSWPTSWQIHMSDCDKGTSVWASLPVTHWKCCFFLSSLSIWYRWHFYLSNPNVAFKLPTGFLLSCKHVCHLAKCIRSVYVGIAHRRFYDLIIDTWKSHQK